MPETLIERYSGEHGNAWNDEMTGVNGVSRIIDTLTLSHISIMGEIDADSEIAFFASQDGVHFYYCDRITQTIAPVPPSPIENLAVDALNFGSSPAVALGDLEDLVEDEGGFAQWARGGVIADLYIWYDFGAGNAARINALEMYCQMSSRAPLQFTFQGSNNSTDGLDGVWLPLYDQTTNLNWVSSQRKDFQTDPPDDYRWYRIVPSLVSDPNNTRINEIKLFGSIATGVDTQIFPKQFHIYPSVGARYIRLRSSENVRATITVAGKP